MSTKQLWKKFKKPIIGLAPMDGYSDSAFRHICKLVNPDIVTYTEFTSADGIHHGAEKLMKKLYFNPAEQPVIAQIFGKNIETFVTASKFCEDMGFSGIDLNMGCPSKKVVKSEHGVALRKNPDLAYKLVEAVANAVSIPVSVKTRLGWSNGDDLAEFGKGVENAGADMICIHARTYLEPYNVPPQWGPVLELKDAVKIPVLGNGGITSLAHGKKVCEKLDGFLIGQASFGNPWIFSETKPNTVYEKLPIMRKHAELLIETKGEQVGSREIRKHLLQYIKGFDGAKSFRKAFSHVTTMDEIHTLLNELANTCNAQPA